MSEFEDKVRSAFEQELAGNEPPPELRERVIRKAVQSEQGVVVSLPPPARPWLGRKRLVQVAALAAAVALVAGGLYARNAFNRPGIAVRSTPSAIGNGPLQAFGKLPPPALHPPVSAFGGGGGGGLQSTDPPPYYGPAKLSWAGKFPSLPSHAPVYRYPVSDPAAYDAFAAQLGAVAVHGPSESGPSVREYHGPGNFDLRIGPSAALGPPFDANVLPAFTLVYSPVAPAPPSRQPSMSSSAAQKAASDVLAKYGLTPRWPSRVSIASYWSANLEEPIYAVRYQRLIDLGGGTKAGLVDGQGQPFGMRVDVAAGGTVMQVSGLLPASEQPATYPLEGEAAAVQHALTAAPTSSTAPSVIPSVALTRVQFVYTGVMREGYAYLEPAYLLSGVFKQAGISQQKLVLVPAITGADIQ